MTLKSHAEQDWQELLIFPALSTCWELSTKEIVLSCLEGEPHDDAVTSHAHHRYCYPYGIHMPSRQKSLSSWFRSIWDHLQIKPIHSSSLLTVSAQLTFRPGWANLTAASSLLQPPSASSQQGCEAVDCTGISWEFWVTHCSLSGSWRMTCWRALTSSQSAKPSCPDCHSKLALPLAQVFCVITHSEESWGLVETILLFLRAHLINCPQ